MPTTVEEVVPYLLGALIIVVVASAYYIRGALEERSRVERERNNLELAKTQLELKMTAQELSYKRELHETIAKLNEDMEKMREKHQKEIDKREMSQEKLEKRITELELNCKEMVDRLEKEKTNLLRANNALRDILKKASIEIPHIDTNATQEIPTLEPSKGESENDGTTQ